MDDTKIKEIARKRSHLELAKSREKEARERLNRKIESLLESDALKTSVEQSTELRQQLANLEATYRGECVEAYQAGEGKQYPGLTVTEKNDYDYNEADAIDWAIEKDHPNLLKLNKREFNKVAKGPLCPEFVTKAIQVGTRLATNLSEFLS